VTTELAQPFNASQLIVLKSLCDAAFQAHSPKEVEEILAAVPADAPEWQREKGKLPLNFKFRAKFKLAVYSYFNDTNSFYIIYFTPIYSLYHFDQL
jgi:hypothetical protein